MFDLIPAIAKAALIEQRMGMLETAIEIGYGGIKRD
jgi:hypothetical protein